MTAAARPRLMYVVTEDWYFVSHRFALARAAVEAGYDVSVVTRVRDHGDRIRSIGVRVIPLEFRRGGLNPFIESATVTRLVGIYRRERPQLVHHVALKPALYGSLAARLAGVPRVLNAVAGMGWVFMSRAGLAAALRPVLQSALGRLLRGKGVHALVQNPADRERLARMGVAPDHLHVVAGSGIDLDEFAPAPEPAGAPVVLLTARMLREKGIHDLVEATRLLRSRGIALRLVLAGEPDPENRGSIPRDEIDAWVAQGLAEYRGHVTDVPALLAGSHIVCLPSHAGEGLPRSLLEAAAAGRPIVTTDRPGCRDVVRDGENGLLVPDHDPAALASALERLLTDPALRARMGAAGRTRAEREWGEAVTIRQMLDLYAEVLA